MFFIFIALQNEPIKIFIMKKFIFISFLVFTILSCFSQQDKKNPPKKVRKYELKIAPFQMLLKQFNVEYERIRDNYSSYGLEGSFHIARSSFYGFYRWYFNSDTDYGAKGFFIEAFAGIHTYTIEKYNFRRGGKNNIQITAPGIGFSLGKKWINKKGYLFQIHFGVGKDTQGPLPMFKGGIYFGIRMKEIKKIF